MLSAAQPTCFLIADISGYTSYLAGVELDHAQDILADLISTVVTALRPNFRLAKLEGDAAFTFAPTETVDGTMLLDTIERCYFGFRRRRRDVRQATACECNACVRIPDLNLKFVVHHGRALRQKMAGREELMGSDVIVVHRLLKNDVVETIGTNAYALISQACIDASDLDPTANAMTPITETYEVIGEVQAWVQDLERRWQEEEGRKRVLVPEEDSVLTVDIPTPAPPQVVWEFVTTPGRRRTWQAGVTDVLVFDTKGGRRGVGTTNHCMHGKDAVVEEILDWRPYDYLTDRSTVNTPMGPIKMLSTLELEPTATGTMLHWRFAAPRTAKERAIMEQLGPMFRSLFEQSRQTLAAQLASELTVRTADDDLQPALPKPKADGLFSEMPQLQMVG
jgi:uncharacterized protein YndB with AHSA1/START domain